MLCTDLQASIVQQVWSLWLPRFHTSELRPLGFFPAEHPDCRLRLALDHRDDEPLFLSISDNLPPAVASPTLRWYLHRWKGWVPKGTERTLARAEAWVGGAERESPPHLEKGIDESFNVHSLSHSWSYPCLNLDMRFDVMPKFWQKE